MIVDTNSEMLGGYVAMTWLIETAKAGGNIETGWKATLGQIPEIDNAVPMFAAARLIEAARMPEAMGYRELLRDLYPRSSMRAG